MNKKPTKKVILSIVLSAIALAVVVILILILTDTQKNQAVQALKPITSSIEGMGGKKICSNGDNGYSLSNRVPWYDVYYRVGNSTSLTDEVKAFARAEGYELSDDVDFINSLKGIDNADGSYTHPYGDEKFNDQSNYLKASHDGSSLEVVINREASVALYCTGGNYGKAESTGNDAIVRLHISLPATQ